jgi:hypothetical protein
MNSTDVFASAAAEMVEKSILRLGGERNPDGSYSFADCNAVVLDVDDQIKNAAAADGEWPFSDDRFPTVQAQVSLGKSGPFAAERRVLLAALLGREIAVTRRAWVAVVEGERGVCEFLGETQRGVSPLGHAVLSMIAACR